MAPHSRSSAMSASLCAPVPKRVNAGESAKPDSRFLPFLKRIMATSDSEDTPQINTIPRGNCNRDRLTKQASSTMHDDELTRARRPSGEKSGATRTKNKAPVWEERQTARSFSLQTFDDHPNREPFEGAHEALRIMNPRHYQMPFGSRVVSIKCGTLQNIYKSLQHGVWACPTNVTKRLEQLFTDRASDAKEKVLFLFSVSGSKQYCGFAEVQGYDPHMVTHFPGDDTVYQGSFIVRWVYCKFISFDEIRKVDLTHDGDSVTQMWNGMHYNEDIGRRVIQAYIEAPHFDNVLACHPANQIDKAHRRRGVGSVATHTSNRAHHAVETAVPRAGTSQFPSHHGSTTAVTGPALPAVLNASEEEITPPSELLSRLRRLHTDEDGLLPPPPPFGKLQNGNRPKVQTMQVVVNADGSIRPATLSETTDQLSAAHTQPLAVIPKSEANPAGLTALFNRIPLRYHDSGVYPFNSLPVAASAMQAREASSFGSLELPQSSARHCHPNCRRQGTADRSLSWPEIWSQPRVHQREAIEPPAPRYSTHHLRHLRGLVQYNDEDKRRFELARRTIEAESRRVLAPLPAQDSHGATDAGMTVERNLGWVDELVASPGSSPSRSRVLINNT